MVKQIKDIDYRGMLPVPHKVSVPDASGILQRGLTKIVGDGARTDMPYLKEVADWLTDNKNRGLLCYGNCGLGKTVVTTHILPRVVQWSTGIIPNVWRASELPGIWPYIYNRRRGIYIIDDLGVESVPMGYAFENVVDDAEKKGNLLIVSTNLSLEDIKDRYGERTFDRLRKLVRTVLFEGRSFRL